MRCRNRSAIDDQPIQTDRRDVFRTLSTREIRHSPALCIHLRRMGLLLAQRCCRLICSITAETPAVDVTIDVDINSRSASPGSPAEDSDFDQGPGSDPDACAREEGLANQTPIATWASRHVDQPRLIPLASQTLDDAPAAPLRPGLTSPRAPRRGEALLRKLGRLLGTIRPLTRPPSPRWISRRSHDRWRVNSSPRRDTRAGP